MQDPTSDMAILAKKGSVLMREMREQKDKDKSRAKFWELAGSKMGNIVGVEKKKETEDATKVTDEGEVCRQGKGASDGRAREGAMQEMAESEDAIWALCSMPCVPCPACHGRSSGLWQVDYR